ncbi:hypothetical protein ZWY2020_017030 [Hordeum vulgare]|nr:hypothetical protein ZWY2020_017030 [Hordeum vulgare]
MQSVPLVIGQFMEMVDGNNGIVGSTTGSNYYVRILSTINRDLLKPSASVALHRHSNALVDVLAPEASSSSTSERAATAATRERRSVPAAGCSRPPLLWARGPRPGPTPAPARLCSSPPLVSTRARLHCSSVNPPWPPARTYLHLLRIRLQQIP